MQLPRYHRLRSAYYRLEGTRCPDCDIQYFPPRTVCPECRREALEACSFAGTGELYSFSRMTQVPRGFRSVGPYTVGMIRLDEGPLVMAQLTDVEGVELSIGMPFEMVTRKIQDSAEHGYIVYGYKFRPRLSEGVLAVDGGSGASTAAP